MHKQNTGCITCSYKRKLSFNIFSSEPDVFVHRVVFCESMPACWISASSRQEQPWIPHCLLLEEVFNKPLDWPEFSLQFSDLGAWKSRNTAASKQKKADRAVGAHDVPTALVNSIPQGRARKNLKFEITNYYCGSGGHVRQSLPVCYKHKPREKDLKHSTSLKKTVVSISSFPCSSIGLETRSGVQQNRLKNMIMLIGFYENPLIKWSSPSCHCNSSWY